MRARHSRPQVGCNPNESTGRFGVGFTNHRPRSGAAVIPVLAQADDACPERERGGPRLLDALLGGRLNRVWGAFAARHPLALTRSPQNRPAVGPGRFSDSPLIQVMTHGLTERGHPSHDAAI